MSMVYMDHAAATPVRSDVIEAMLPYFDRHFGNPSLVYDLGTRVKEDLDTQRARVASLIGARPGRSSLRHQAPRPITSLLKAPR